MAKGHPGIDLLGPFSDINAIRNDVSAGIRSALLQVGFFLVFTAQQHAVLGIAIAMGAIDQLVEPVGRDGRFGRCYGIHNDVRRVTILQWVVDKRVNEIGRDLAGYARRARPALADAPMG